MTWEPLALGVFEVNSDKGFTVIALKVDHIGATPSVWNQFRGVRDYQELTQLNGQPSKTPSEVILKLQVSVDPTSFSGNVQGTAECSSSKAFQGP